MQAMMRPYVKEYDLAGNVKNPITKETPYLHPKWQFEHPLTKEIMFMPYPNNQARNSKKRNKVNNRKLINGRQKVVHPLFFYFDSKGNSITSQEYKELLSQNKMPFKIYSGKDKIIAGRLN